MDLEDIFTFITLAELKNFTRTAEMMNVVQSTVSNRIRTVEQYLNAQLVIRDKSGIRLTGEGEAFLSYAKNIRAITDMAIQEIQTYKAFKGILNIGCVHWIYDCCVQQLLEQFIRENPDISVNITKGHTSELIPMVCERGLDVAFIQSEVHSYNVQSCLFAVEPIVFVGGPRFASYQGGIEREQLGRLPLIYADVWDNYLSDISASILSDKSGFQIRCNLLADALAFCRSELGCCFLPFGMVKDDLAAKRLVEIPILHNQNSCASAHMAYTKWEPSYALSKWLAFLEHAGHPGLPLPAAAEPDGRQL